jgi:DNA repair exonuclease SbcCD ATPase subunit
MLEKLLGLEWFDDACKQARADLKDATQGMDHATSRLTTLDERKADLLEKVEFFTTQLAETGDADDSTDAAVKLKKYKKLRAGARDEMRTGAVDVQKKQRELSRSEAKLEGLTEKLDALKDANCHTCGQPVPKSLQDELSAAIEDETAKLDGLRVSAAKWLEEVQEDISVAQAEVEELDSRIASTSALVKVSQAQQESRKKAQRGVKQAKLDLKVIAKGLTDVAELLKKAEPKVAELQVCAAVLGLKGVRAHVLGEMLCSIQGVANQWLGRLSDGKLQMELKPYSDKGVKDAISLRVRGGNFARMSGGERRRVDVSILLALSQIGLSTAGVQDSWPMIFDEVFDALDADGIARGLTALTELSQTRPAIVITHSWRDELAELADLVLHVEDGVIS